MANSCENCAAFNREHLRTHASYKGDTRIPPTAACRRSAPPWHTVSGNDWCLQWTPRPTRSAVLLPDDGA